MASRRVSSGSFLLGDPAIYGRIASRVKSVEKNAEDNSDVVADRVYDFIHCNEESGR